MPTVTVDPQTGHMLVDGKPVATDNRGWAGSLAQSGMVFTPGGWFDPNSQVDEFGQFRINQFTPEQLSRMNGMVPVRHGVGGETEVIDPSQVVYDPQLGFLTKPENVAQPIDSNLERIIGATPGIAFAAGMGGLLGQGLGLWGDPFEALLGGGGGSAPAGTAPGTIPINPATPLTEGIPAWATQPGGWEGALTAAGSPGGAAGLTGDAFLDGITSSIEGTGTPVDPSVLEQIAADAANNFGLIEGAPGIEGALSAGIGMPGTSFIDQLINGATRLAGNLPAIAGALKPLGQQPGGGLGGLGGGGGGGLGGGGLRAGQVDAQYNPYLKQRPQAVPELAQFLRG